MSGHLEQIKCPKCGEVQQAPVVHSKPFWTYVKECKKCKYYITESEFDIIENRKDLITRNKLAGLLKN